MQNSTSSAASKKSISVGRSVKSTNTDSVKDLGISSKLPDKKRFSSGVEPNFTRITRSRSHSSSLNIAEETSQNIRKRSSSAKSEKESKKLKKENKAKASTKPTNNISKKSSKQELKQGDNFTCK